MNRNVLVIVVLAVLALLTVAAYTQRETLQSMLGANLADVTPSAPVTETTSDIAATPDTSTEASESADSTTHVVVDLAEQNDSGQTGTATLMEENGKVVVTLDMKGGTFTIPQPAHIHAGACPTPGAVKYPLTNVANGKSETTLAVDMKTLISGLPLAVNVHKSAAEIAVYTACGDIEAGT